MAVNYNFSKKKVSLMKKISRVLVLPAALIAVNASAVCPLFQNKIVDVIGNNRQAIGTTIFSDKMYDKNEHFKKAFVCSAGHAWDKGLIKTADAPQFVERVVVDYMIRKGSDVIGLNGYRDAIVKKLDVLPAGMARDMVNPVVEGVAEVATHPEVLTYVVLNVVVPMALGAKSADVK
jgi:hypothetical protein